MIRNAEPIEVGYQCTACIVFAEALVIMKAIAWRPKDQQDIRDIVGVNPEYDRRSVVGQFAECAELLEVPDRLDELRELIRLAQLG